MSALPLKADTCTALAAVRFGPIADIPPIIRSPPGAELAFSSAVTVTEPRFVVGWKAETLRYATAIFRQVNNNGQWTHHDALEFPDGRIVLLTQLCSGQEATILQLPAQPMTVAEAEVQKRLVPVG